MRISSSRGSAGGWIFLMLFSLPFAGVGIFMTVWLWKDVLESRRILSEWVSTPAVVLSAELKTSRTSKGGTTYRATGEFSYQYEGRAYSSERVALSDEFDNIGDFQKRLNRRMKSAQQSGRKIDCFVNPAEPAQAVLDPSWRPEMTLFRAMFGITFGGVGLAMFGGGVVSAVGAARAGGLKRRHPQEPWLWREAWQNPVIEARLGGGMVAAGLALAWINLATWPLWSAVRPAWSSDGVFKWVLSGALALVVVASAFCLRVIIHARKYRGARVDLGPLPLHPGSPVEARLYVPQSLPIGATLKVVLLSERSVTTGSGKQRRTTKTKLWSHEHEISGPLAPGQAVVVRCRLPDDAEESTPETPENGVAWRLEARAKVPGVDLKLDFELPVFRGPRTA